MKSQITKIFSIIIILLFAAFALFIYSKKQTNIVLNVLAPNVIQVDLNNNNIVDENETVCVMDAETFSTDLSAPPPEFAKDLNHSDVLALGYLADEFANNLLFLKPVKVKFTGKSNADCRFAQIYIDGDNYSDKLLHSGFASIKGNFDRESFNFNLQKARKLKLVILNLKSFKYHNTDCEYGLMSSDYALIPSKQLPKDAKPCKFCHVKKEHAQNLPAPKSVISDGSIKIFLTDFTKKLKPDTDCNSDVCRAVLDNINNSKTSIDIALYGYDRIPKIENALKNAKARGVKIRLVYDMTTGDYYYKDTFRLVNLADVSKSDFVEGNSLQTNKLMHNKFMIFDNKTVLTGSMNFSSTGLSGFNANAVALINSADIAKLYTAEFEQMLDGKFHDAKSKLDLPHKFITGDNEISVYFSPCDKATQYIIPIIDSAKKYIYMPTFLITHAQITNALLRAKKRGVDVKIIIDANNTATRNSKHNILRSNGIPLKTENYAGKMHSKSMIIDGEYIITGSMNFSNSGENKNDENMIIIKNAKLAKVYAQFFEYIWEMIPDRWLTHNVRAESQDSIGSCTDGIDNNFDGKIDLDDAGCGTASDLKSLGR